MEIFEELEQFNWINPSKEELNNMIDHIKYINEELTEEQEKELYDYLNELEDMKKQQEHEYDDFDYFDDNKDRLYYGVE
jgi:hypothetical protein